jgi:hypothetical protein
MKESALLNLFDYLIIWYRGFGAERQKIFVGCLLPNRPHPRPLSRGEGSTDHVADYGTLLLEKRRSATVLRTSYFVISNCQSLICDVRLWTLATIT